MTDAENSDDERYANESFENESDTDVPEISEFETESTQNSDEDDEDLPSVKINTGPIKRNIYACTFNSNNKNDLVPFASSSDEEDDAIVGQTLAEINTPSMHFEDELLPAPNSHLVARLFLKENSHSDDDIRETFEEISEPEDDEEEEFKKIQEMEEKYVQQVSVLTSRDTNFENDIEDKVLPETSPSTIRNHKYIFGSSNNCSNNDCKVRSSSETQSKHEKSTREGVDQTNSIQRIQSSVANLNIGSSKANTKLVNQNDSKVNNTCNTICPEEIPFTVVNALKSAGAINSESNQRPETLEQNRTLNEKLEESNSTAEVPHNEGFIEEKEIVEVEELENNNYDHSIYYDGHFDYRITSKTPTSFNSDDYVFHANFIKSFHRTSSTEKLRVKPHPRKSMSFSNERMREIERHNQILLRKILTQKPTYGLKSRTLQPSLQKLSLDSNARLTTSAVNRKKQRRQINLDNQILKRKLEAIALRKNPLIS